MTETAVEKRVVGIQFVSTDPPSYCAPFGREQMRHRTLTAGLAETYSAEDYAALVAQRERGGPFFHFTMPECGTHVDYRTEADVPLVDTPCPCGNPAHWLVKWDGPWTE